MSNSTNPGPGVDAQGRSVVDPTANVIAILQAAVQRQDDLREYEADCIREVITLRAEYDEKLRVSESARIDAIRAVDVGAVNRAAEVSAAQATTLATQVVASAEALRVQVEASRVQTATGLAAALDPIQKDIADLRRVQYEQAGQKSAGADVRDTRAEARNFLVGILGVLGVAAVVISPHIH